jgi:G3E family GTPase
MIALSYKRPNCFADISKFLHLLKEDEKAEFFTFVENEFKDQFEVCELIVLYKISLLQTLTNAYFIRELLRTSFGHYHRMEISKRNDYLIKLVTDLRVNSKHNPELDTHAKSVAVIVANTLWDTYIETGR